MVIFHSYVSLPEGTHAYSHIVTGPRTNFEHCGVMYMALQPKVQTLLSLDF